MPTNPREGAGPARPAGLGPDDFARRFEEAAPTLWTVAAGILGDRGQAGDVLQEACVIALDKLDRFEPGTSFSAWMGAFVRNVACNAARKTRRRATQPTAPDVLDEAHAGPAPAPGGFPVDERGELLCDRGAFDDDLVAALCELRPVARAALLLRTVRELDYREIALVLGIPEGTAMSHVHRARQALRRRLAALEERPAKAVERSAGREPAWRPLGSLREGV